MDLCYNNKNSLRGTYENVRLYTDDNIANDEIINSFMSGLINAETLAEGLDMRTKFVMLERE